MTTNSDDIDTDKKLDEAEAPKPRTPIYPQEKLVFAETPWKFNIGDYVQVETPAGYRVLARVHKQGPDPVSGVPSYQLQLIPESSYLFLSQEWMEAYGGRVGQ